MIINDVAPCGVTRFDLAETMGITVPIGTDINIKNKHNSNNPNEYGANISEDMILDV